MTNAAAELQQKQLQQAEELLFSGPQSEGFAKRLFQGRFLTSAIMPYPLQSTSERTLGDQAVGGVSEFVHAHLDPDQIDQMCDIPASVISGLGRLGVLGMTISPQHGGRGLSQQNYCRVMEVIGARCASTAVFVNAHHSIGLRALELFGTTAQKSRWLAPLARGEQIAAFALTEAEAGSDAANVRTTATPTPDGKGYILNGSKRYITNGALADVLTVMARTPDARDPDGKVTAFLVTRDMVGFEVLEPRMPKCGIRGTATARLAFNLMYVPRENVLGEVGAGLKLALTVLNFGRTTFGASCTGAAKFCLELALSHARRRRQFGKSLGEFELIKQKLAMMAADTFAMESATYHTAALIDSKAKDYMLETAMLKVFASDALWRIVNEALQIHGGAGYFNDMPLERMMRDARINLIGEGANEVLRCFVAMVGLRGVGENLKSVLKQPWTVGKLCHVKPPQFPVPNSLLVTAAQTLGNQIRHFANICQWPLIQFREGIIEKEHIQARLGDIAIELYMASCVYSRLAGLGERTDLSEKERSRQWETGLSSLKFSYRRNQQRFRELKENDDATTNRLADHLLESGGHLH